MPIDFPDFNLRLAERARRRDVGVVYFVSPQVWAWRPRRVERIRDLVREMLVLFDFESGFYEQAGVPVTWVGHPLAERDSAGTDTLCGRSPASSALRAVSIHCTSTSETRNSPPNAAMT